MDRDWGRFFDLVARQRHQAWLDAGRTGAGRIDVSDLDMSNMSESGVRLIGIRMQHCKLDGGKLTYATLDESVLIECTAVRATFYSTDIDRAVIRDCEFTNANCRLAHFIGAQITGGSFSETWFDRATFFDAVLEKVDLQRASFVDAKLDRARFVECDLRGANFSRAEELLKKLGSSVETRFERCDLRGAKFGGRKFDRTVFDRCKVHGVSGRPEMLGPITVIEPDFSPEGDGSDIREADALLALWQPPPGTP